MVTLLQQIKIKEKEKLNYSPIKISEVLERGIRLDAAHYDAESRHIRSLMLNYSGEKKIIGELIELSFVPPPIKRIYTNNHNIGTPYLTPTNLLKLKIKHDKMVIANRMDKIEDWFVKKDWLIITQSGLVGIPIMVTKSMEKYIISQNAIRLVFKNADDAYYVYGLLSTKLGNKLVTTNNYGSVVTHIEPEHIEAIQIPYFQKELRKKIISNLKISVANREQAANLMKEANELLVHYLNLKPLIDVKREYFYDNNTRNYTQKFSKLDFRFDAAHHEPVYDYILKHLSRHSKELIPLSEPKISDRVILPGRFKRIYVAEEFGIPFLGGKQILETNPSNVKYLSIKHHSERMNKELLLKENMIIVTCSGTIGNLILTPKYLENYVGSQHIMRIIPSKKINPGYLFAYLDNEYGNSLIMKQVYGSVVDEINDEQIGKVLVPILDDDTMDKIGDKVLMANKLRSDAFNLDKQTKILIRDELLGKTI